MSSKPKILIFEDDPFVIDILKQKFQEAGLEVKNYISPPDNLVEEAFKEKPDIILMSIIMPDNVDGFEATRMLKADSRTKEIPIIILTSVWQKEDIQKGLDMGAADYLCKSKYTPTQVVEFFKNYLEKKSEINFQRTKTK